MARWEIGAGNVGGDQGGQQVFYGGQGVSLPANEGQWRGQPPGTSGRSGDFVCRNKILTLTLL